jgi:hypothetical protein
MKKEEIPIQLSGAEIKKTALGWKAKCKRCGAELKFGKHEIETTGSGFELSAYKLVASGYIYAKEHNELADDVEAKKIDWLEFLRRQRRLYYRMAEIPNSAFSMQTSIKLICEECGAETFINVSIGGEIELKKLPNDVEALLALGIKDKENIRNFQLRTGKLASKFIETIEVSEDEIQQLEKCRDKVVDLIGKLESPTSIVADLLSDVSQTAKASADLKIRELREWQKTMIEQVQKPLFPMEHTIVETEIEPPRRTTAIHTA